jgi:hypothetical protein
MSQSLPNHVADALSYASLGLIALGLGVLQLGLFSRRRGSEPRCRRCGYDATGNVSGRCPECGADLSARRAVVIGVRHRRRGLIALAIVLILGGLGTGSPRARQFVASIEWYHHVPASWVVRDFDSPMAVTRDRAFDEILRREKAGNLSASKRHDFIERMLRAYVSAPEKLPGNVLKELLARTVSSDMDDEQRNRFYGTTFPAHLDVRPRVEAGKEVPWRLRLAPRPLGVSYGMRAPVVLAFTVDGRPSTYADRRLADLRTFWDETGRMPPQPAGRHELKLHLRYRVFLDARKAEPLGSHEQEVTLTAPFDVLPAGTPDVIEEAADGVQRSALSASIRVEKVVAECRSKHEVLLHCDIWPMLLPADMSFDAFLRFDGREVPAGQVVASKADNPTGLSLTVPATYPPPKTVTLVLRSNPEWAHGTVNVRRIWKGELVYKDLPVYLFTAGGEDEPAPPR